MLNFTPLESTVGGALIGLSATTLLLGNGDILGCSGIISSLVLKPKEAISNPQNKWKLVFLSSFLVTSNLYHIFILKGDASVHKVPEEGSIRVINDVAYVVGGFLVGIGTRLGNGCTSGHGICGLARFSKRSLAAVMTFMATGIGMASLVAEKQVFSTVNNDLTWVPNEISKQVSSSVVALFATAAASVLAKSCVKTRPSSDSKESTENKESQRKTGLKKSIIGAVAGSLFSAGLAMSGMIKQYKVLGFLNLSDINKWDPSLMFVMGGGLIISFGGYQFVKGHGIFRKEKALTCPPLLGNECKFNVPTNTKIDKQLILGSAMFGMGWGIAGLCPGPALFSFATGFPKVMLLWWPSNIIGTIIGEQAKKLF